MKGHFACSEEKIFYGQVVQKGLSGLVKRLLHCRHPGHAGKEGPQLARTGASQGFPRAAAPVGVFSRGTKRISGSLSCGTREVRSPCAWRGGARDQEGRRGSEEAVPGPSVFPSREPGVSGNFCGSQEGCQLCALEILHHPFPWRTLSGRKAGRWRPPLVTERLCFSPSDKGESHRLAERDRSLHSLHSSRC